MSLLRRTRTELGGAWRSLRYDLGRRPTAPDDGGPDMTSTGMGTFAGAAVPAAPRRTGAGIRSPRKALAVSTFGVLTVAGAAGAYLGVVNGLGSLVSGSSAEAGTLRQRPVAITPVRPAAEDRAGAAPGGTTTKDKTAVPPHTDSVPAGTGPAGTPLGGTARHRPGTTGGTVSTATGGLAPVAPVVPGAVPPAPVTTRPHHGGGPVRTTGPVRPQPPVPTPTAPATSPSPTPSATVSSPVPSESAPATGTPSAEPGEPGEESTEPQSRRARQHG